MGSITPGMTGGGFGGGYTPNLPTMAPNLNSSGQPQISVPNFNALPGANSPMQGLDAAQTQQTPDINELLKGLMAGAGAAKSTPGMQAQPPQLPITPSPGPTFPMFGCGQKLNRLA
jgi:hypothetical protein